MTESERKIAFGSAAAHPKGIHLFLHCHCSSGQAHLFALILHHESSRVYLLNMFESQRHTRSLTRRLCDGSFEQRVTHERQTPEYDNYNGRKMFHLLRTLQSIACPLQNEIYKDAPHEQSGSRMFIFSMLLWKPAPTSRPVKQ